MLDNELGNAIITSGPGSAWAHFAELDTWLWQPRPLAYDGTLDILKRLRAEGYEQIDEAHHEARLTALFGQLANVVTLVWPGSGTRRDHWALREDIERADAVPVALAFTIPDDAPLPELGKENYRVLPMAVALPPPQLGERALILQSDKWQTRGLGSLDDAGLNLWHQMGAALKQLNAPAEWWMHSRELERVAIPAEYQAMRDELRSRLLATRGQEREAVRESLANLERIRKNAEKLRKVKERAQRNQEDWRAQWHEVQRMAQELAALYWAAHQQAVSVPATVAVLDAAEPEAEPSEDGAILQSEPALAAEASEEAGMIAQLIESSADSMDTTSYAEDRAVREASLAPKGDWLAEADVPRFNASNNLAVYFLDREHPLSLEEAQAQLLRITPRTALTLRIALGLWNLRRHDAKLGRNGAALIAYNEVLQWRGVAKHTQAAYPGSGQRFTDGYRTEDREDVRRDFELASRYYLRGQHIVMYKGKARTLSVKGHYVNVSFISEKTLWGTEEPRGVWFGPGEWINDYEEADNYYLAEIERRAFQLNPHHEQHELKLALYLTELWRYQARSGRYAEPITMAELLERSVIAIDRKHIERFAPRIEAALENLRQRGIIGSCECLTPPDSTKARWAKAWLAARWRILPPDTLRQSYLAKGITKDARLLPPGQKGK